MCMHGSLYCNGLARAGYPPPRAGSALRVPICAKKGDEVRIDDSDNRTMREHRSESDERGSSDVVGEVVVSISRSNLRR